MYCLAPSMSFCSRSSSAIVEREVRPQPHQRHAAVGESLLDLPPLGLGQARLHAVRVFRSQFHAQNAGLLAVGDHRRQVPVLSPQVGHEPELHLRARLLGGHDPPERTGRDDSCAQNHGTPEKLPACAANCAHIAAFQRHARSEPYCIGFSQRDKGAQTRNPESGALIRRPRSPPQRSDPPRASPAKTHYPPQKLQCQGIFPVGGGARAGAEYGRGFREEAGTEGTTWTAGTSWTTWTPWTRPQSRPVHGVQLVHSIRNIYDAHPRWNGSGMRISVALRGRGRPVSPMPAGGRIDTPRTGPARRTKCPTDEDWRASDWEGPPD